MTQGTNKSKLKALSETHLSNKHEVRFYWISFNYHSPFKLSCSISLSRIKILYLNMLKPRPSTGSRAKGEEQQQSQGVKRALGALRVTQRNKSTVH